MAAGARAVWPKIAWDLTRRAHLAHLGAIKIAINIKRVLVEIHLHLRENKALVDQCFMLYQQQLTSIACEKFERFRLLARASPDYGLIGIPFARHLTSNHDPLMMAESFMM